MKKAIFTFLSIGAVTFGFSQSTYYWVGGTSGTFASSTSFNTQLDGNGSARTTPNNGDVLIFDGANIGGTIPTTGQVTPVITAGFTIAQLKLQNAADVVLKRGSSGTATAIINGDVAPSGGTDDLTVDASSKLTITASTAANNFVLQLGVAGTNIATGVVAGTVSVLDANTALARIGVQNAAALNFVAGSVFNSLTSFTSSYPFGSSAQGVIGGAVFKTGSAYVYKGGNNPYSNSTLTNFIFEKGGNFIFEAINAASIFSNGRIFANVVVRNNAVVTSDGNFFNIDTLTVNPGATFNIRGSGTAPFSGNIINNGTFGAVSTFTTSNMIMYGTVPQSILGTGTFTSLGALSVATGSDVTLERSLVIGGQTSSTVTGKLNFKTNTLTGIDAWNAKTATVTSFTGDITSGSQVISNLSVFSGIGVGSLVVGSNIPPGSIIIATSLGVAPGGTVTISKVATATTTGVSFTGSNSSPTLETSNPGGIDASIATSSTRTFGDGTSFIFDAATSSPFSIGSNNIVGNITANANITSNKVVTTNGIVSLNAAKFTIRGGDSLYLSPAASFGGAFNAANYIATDVSGSTTGVVVMTDFTTAKTFPVGNPNYYMPVTLTPVTQSTFAISVFQGTTEDGTPTGTPYTPAKKANVVDAVWTINRMSSNTDNCTVNVTWPQALEGSNFSSFPNGQIGITRFNGSTWDPATGGGDNSNNNATGTFAGFSPFGVAQIGGALPVKINSITAKAEQGKIKLEWNNETEMNTLAYVIERSENGVSFSAIGNVVANGNYQYVWYDVNPAPTNNYYRITVKDRNGNLTYSNVVRIKLNFTNAEFSVYPNPVINGQLNLQLSNLSKGKITLDLYNTAGQLVFNTSVEYNGSIQTQTIRLPLNISKGNYTIVAKDAAHIFNQKIIIQ